MADIDVKKAKKMIGEEVDKLRSGMNEMAHQMYLDPEVGWETPRSAALVGSFLKKYGFEVEEKIADLSSAFKAYLPERYGHHPAVAILAEYDALPEIGHACGHNLQGPVAAGAAIALSKVMSAMNIPGSVYVMGCPCEEGGGGKVIMLDKGAFEQADYSIHWHIANNPANRTVVGCPNNAAVRSYVRFHGKSAHSISKAHKAVSALDAALLTLTAVNTMQRYLIPERFERVHGVILRGGEAANVIPDFCEIEFTIRAKHRVYLEELIKKVHNCAHGAALATGAKVEIKMGLMYYERIVLQSFRRAALDNLPLLGLPVEERDPRITGSADSNNVSHHIPHLTCKAPITDDASIGGHTVEMAKATDSDMAREAMNKYAKWMAMIALDIFTKPDLRKEIQEEFKERKQAADMPVEGE